MCAKVRSNLERVRHQSSSGSVLSLDHLWEEVLKVHVRIRLITLYFGVHVDGALFYSERGAAVDEWFTCSIELGVA